MRTLLFSALLVFVAIYFFTERLWLTEPNKQISFAIILSNESNDDFVSGINLAVEEVNQAGGLLNRPLSIKFYHEITNASSDQQNGMIPPSMSIATEIAKDPSIIAGITDSNGGPLLPEATVFNNLKKLLFATSAASTTLTNVGLRYVFALQLSQEDIATALAHFAQEKNLSRFVIIGDNSLASVNMGRRFQSKLADNSARVLFSTNLPGYSHDQIERTLIYIKNNNSFESDEIDAFFFSASQSIDYTWFIKRIRELGFQQPVFGPSNMLSSQLESLVGPNNMKNITSISIDYNQIESDEKKLPKSEYRYQLMASSNKSISAYNSIKLLSYAINSTNSVDSTVLSNFIRSVRYNTQISSHFGNVAFDGTGRITDCNISIISHDGISFKTVAEYAKPFSWSQNSKAYSHSILQPLNNRDW